MKTEDALLRMFCKNKDKTSLTDDESEDFSDIDDNEVKFYLNNEKESRYRKIIWEKINKEYLQDQAFKKLAGDAAVPRKSKKRRRQKEVVKSNPAEAETEGTHEVQTKKRLSSKINFDVLDKLFPDSTASGSSKTLEASSCEEKGSTSQNHCRNQLGEDLEENYSDAVLEEDDDRGHEDPTETYGDEYFDYENEEEYGYNYDNYGEDDGY